MSILSKPFLPETRVKTVLMSYIEQEGRTALEKLGIDVITANPHNNLSVHVAHHPDMQFLHLKDNKCVVIDKSTSFLSKLKNLGFSIIEAENNYGKEYPFDIGLNVVILNGCVIGKTDYIDGQVKKELQDYKFINVSQGYTKCSVCIVNEHSLITEDESIYRKLKNNFDVLKIESNCVELKGYNYGFFGGCTGLIHKNLLAINGELKYHKSCNDIISFLKYRNVNFIELKAGSLCDIGSILPLEEQ